MCRVCDEYDIKPSADPISWLLEHPWIIILVGVALFLLGYLDEFGNPGFGAPLR